MEPKMRQAEEVLRESCADGRQAAVVVVEVEHGRCDFASSESLVEHAVFEIGSLNKVLTAAAFASMILDGSASMSTSVRKIFDAEIDPRLTLGSLATHTSGLPFLPENIGSVANLSPLDPYAGYAREHMFEALAVLEVNGNSAPSYSNFGFMVLGEALADLRGASYDDVLDNYVLQPLGMTATRVAGSSNGRLAQPHAEAAPVPPWTVQLRGAGGYESSIQDLGRLLDAALASDGPVHDALLLTRVRAEKAQEYLAWQPYGPNVVWHNGGTGGSTSFLGLNQERSWGVAILTNHDDPKERITGTGLNTLGITNPLFGG